MVGKHKSTVAQPKSPAIRDAVGNISSDHTRSKPSSLASVTPTTSEGMDDVRSLSRPGAFDDDEGPRSLQAVWAAKRSKTAGVSYLCIIYSRVD
jgi:hypothetical protein